jgi:NADPH-dependent glutamate synthase beta subunit-like oxidoreductase
MPRRIVEQDGRVAGVDLEYTARRLRDGRLVGTGETLWIDADQVFKAIGQNFDPRRSMAAAAASNWRMAASASMRKAAPPPPWSGPAATAPAPARI